MRDYEEEFNQFIKGSDELYLWKTQIECDFVNGKKIDKTKYQKIFNLYEERRNKARELLDIINSHSSKVRTCMPPPLPPIPTSSK